MRHPLVHALTGESVALCVRFLTVFLNLYNLWLRGHATRIFIARVPNCWLRTLTPDSRGPDSSDVRSKFGRLPHRSPSKDPIGEGPRRILLPSRASISETPMLFQMGRHYGGHFGTAVGVHSMFVSPSEVPRIAVTSFRNIGCSSGISRARCSLLHVSILRTQCKLVVDCFLITPLHSSQ